MMEGRVRMAKTLKGGSSKSASSRNSYLSKTAGSTLSQYKGKSYGISSDSKKTTKAVTTSSAIKVSSKMSASTASKVLRDGRYGAAKKSIAGSVLGKKKR